MTISLRNSPDITALAQDLASVLAAPRDPLQTIQVVVPSGLKQWLIQQLSMHLGASAGRYDGVAAGINFMAPSQVVQFHQRLEFSGWQRTDVMWEIMGILHELLAEAESGQEPVWAAPLLQYLRVESKGERRRRTYHVASKSAALFAEYLAQRPQMVRQWRADEGSEVAVGEGFSAAAGLQGFAQAARSWQEPLWRLVDSRLQKAVEQEFPEVRTGELYVFMPWDLPESFIEALQWWGQQAPVRIWWQSQPAGASVVPQWGNHQQRVQEQLEMLAPSEEIARDSAPVIGGLLHSNPKPTEPIGRQKVRFYPCPSRRRQVEVMRDAITAALEADPSLQPRDVLVLCPNVAEFEPHIRAAFAPTKNELGHPAGNFPLAIQTAHTHNVLAEVIACACVEVPVRATSQQILDVLEQEPVREKYQLDDDDLARIRSWVMDSNIRWGLNQDHTGAYGLDHLANNTWDDGLNRLTLSAATGQEGQWGDVAAVTEVGSQEVELLGKLNHLVAVLERLRTVIADGLTGGQWAEVINWLLQELTPESFGDGTERLAVDQCVTSLAQVPEIIGAAEYMDQLLLATRSSRWAARSGSGAITVSDINEVVFIPHRLVVLVGFDEGTYPHASGSDGDNLLELEQLERDEASSGSSYTAAQQRHLFSAAVQSATDQLVVIYSGFDPGSKVSLPPAMVISELAEALQIDLSRSSKDAQVWHQPLLAHDPQNFQETHEPASFDSAAATWAQDLRDTQVNGGITGDDPWLSTLADASIAAYSPPQEIAVTALKSALAHPLKAFIEQRLNIYQGRENSELPVHIPVHLDGLDSWQIGNQTLIDLMRGRDYDAAVNRAAQQGLLPPGELRSEVLAQVDVVPHIAAEINQLSQGPDRENLEVGVQSGSRLIYGVIEDVAQHRIVRGTYSRFNPDKLLHLWVDLVVAVAHGYPVERGYAIFRGEGKVDGQKVGLPEVFALEAPSASSAHHHLRTLVELYDAVMREPLPVATHTAYTLVTTALDPKNPDGWSALSQDWETLRESAAWAAAARAWDNSWGGDSLAPEVGLLYAGKPWFTGGGSGIGDQEVLARDGVPESRSRLVHYAMKIWEPVISHLVNAEGGAW